MYIINKLNDGFNLVLLMVAALFIDFAAWSDEFCACTCTALGHTYAPVYII